MRREGYEFAVSRPTVILKEVEGQIHEPIERLWLDVEETYIGTVMEGLGRRRGEMVNMGSAHGSHVRLEFEVPSRGLIGYRSEFLTATRGTGIMNYTFSSFQPYKGEISSRTKGVLISMETGEAILFSLHHIQERGVLFVAPGEKIYEGMVIGEHSRANDLVVNASKKKHLTNFRSSTAEDALVLTQPRKMSLEEAIAFLADDELLEVTPQTIRLRKKYLSDLERKRSAKK